MKGRIVYGGKPLKRFFLDDREVSEEEFHAAFPSRVQDLLRSGKVPGGHLPSCWPMKSEALAVHPKQVEQANARNKRHGVNVVYDPRDGRAILPDRNERKKLLRLEGFHDNQAGYGD